MGYYGLTEGKADTGSEELRQEDLRAIASLREKIGRNAHREMGYELKDQARKKYWDENPIQESEFEDFHTWKSCEAHKWGENCPVEEARKIFNESNMWDFRNPKIDVKIKRYAGYEQERDYYLAHMNEIMLADKIEKELLNWAKENIPVEYGKYIEKWGKL